MSKLTRDGTAEPVSRDQMLRRERGQGNVHFCVSADHEQDWQTYPVDPYSCYMCDHTLYGGNRYVSHYYRLNYNNSRTPQKTAVYRTKRLCCKSKSIHTQNSRNNHVVPGLHVGNP